jgi:dihydrodipicolinate reductase
MAEKMRKRQGEEIRVCVAGATGKIGHALVEGILRSEDLELIWLMGPVPGSMRVVRCS